MVAWCFRLVTAWLALIAGPALAQTHIQPRLVAESSAPAPGSKVTIALDMRTDKGWHGYWTNPGEAGFAPRLDWDLPYGFSLYGLEYPVPERLRVAGLMNHVFNGDHALILTFDVSSDLKPGTKLPVRLAAEWLACTDEVCVPEKATVALDLVVGDGNIRSVDRAQFDVWRSKLPRPLDAEAHYQLDGNRMRIGIPYPASAAAPIDPWFFAESERVIDYAAPQTVRRTGDWLVIETHADLGAREFVKKPEHPDGRRDDALRGVLSIGRSGLEVRAVAGPVPTGGEVIGGAAKVTSVAAILLAVGGAILGGLILNIMPCVFPIVSLKALSLARAGGDEGAAKREALAYAAGVIVACLTLGAIVLGVRAGGTQIGWAFQLQDPRIVFVLLLLATAITLNLAGFFELRGFGGGEALAGKDGVQGAFWTGILAAFVATPCTGPFMAAALGAALVLPVPAALAIFAGLGLGLALPFLAVGFVPALRRRLPKPGAWMKTFQRALAIPMALTVLALLWLIYRQQGSAVFDWAVVAVAVIGVIASSTGRRQTLPQPRTLAIVLGVMLVAGAITIKVDGINSSKAIAASQFSEERLAALRAQGKPVFVYFTADWCLTCKVNEKTAIETKLARNAFRAGDVTVLQGDWTNGDAKITRFLNAHGVSGVPLYLYYPKGGGEPHQLPQILTPALLANLTSS